MAPTITHLLRSNLLSNATKFSSSPGAITFTVGESEVTDDGVTLTFTIKDTGIGIKAETIPLLFQPFHQADASTARKYGGTGLGLSIVKSVRRLPCSIICTS
jgi:signal transduction histidine kinase